jgi:hypothetical protein
MMKKLLVVFVLLSMKTALLAQTPDFGMETWQDVFGYKNPQGWASANLIANGDIVKRDTIRKNFGQASAAITTIVLPTNPIPQFLPDTSGVMLTGSVVFLPSIGIRQGFSHITRTNQVGFYAFYEPQGNDEALIYVTLTKRNASGTNQRDTIASGSVRLTGTNTTFQPHLITLDYASYGFPSSLLPDSALIIVSSSKRNGASVGSKLWVDDFYFDPVSMSFDEKSSFGKARIYPQPATDRVRIEFGDIPNLQSITILDAMGRRVEEMQLTNNQQFVDLQHYAAGIYSYVLVNREGIIADRGKIHFSK